MKQPDEIKNALDLCSTSGCPDCAKCAYDGDECCLEEKSKDSLAYIQQLESRLAQVERERDAAADCIQKVYTMLSKPAETVTSARDYAIWSLYAMNDYFRQWRGVCPENTKEETK